MKSLTSLSLLLAASAALVSATASPHDKHEKYKRSLPVSKPAKVAPRAKLTSKYLTNTTASYAVNGSALPDVDFNIGESYAGTLPISNNASDTNRLWFWFFPSDNPLAEKEITIWLNGGPGCSSLDGLFQENGPFSWQSGTYAPVPNPYSWTNLTNMVWIDQPVSTGFSPGNALVNDETDVATQFNAFWKNFIDTFSMQGYKVYITGESYAGQYIPYIASAMLDHNDTTYYNVKGVQINDPSINHDDTLMQAPVTAAAIYYQNVLNLNETYLANVTARAKSCGYTDFLETYTTSFPPPGPIPAAPSSRQPGCDLFDDIYNAVYYVNPCFNIYHLTDFCPYLWDELGFPSLAGGPNNYFNRSDVQEVIHAPPTNYFICGGGENLFPKGDKSLPSALGPLPSVIERTNNTIIGHGLLDFLLFANGSLITIQNMTWNGLQGFQTPPSKAQNLYVPYHQSLGYILEIANAAIPNTPAQIDTAGAGFQGNWHTERGLTWTTVNLAGHEIPQYTPGAAYRQLEFLLGRIDNLSVVGDFTTQTGNFTGVRAMTSSDVTGVEIQTGPRYRSITESFSNAGTVGACATNLRHKKTQESHTSPMLRPRLVPHKKQTTKAKRKRDQLLTLSLAPPCCAVDPASQTIKSAHSLTSLHAFNICTSTTPHQSTTTMINNSRAEYVFIRVCIFALQSIPVISLAYCLSIPASYLFGYPIRRLPLPLECWFLAESIFFLFCFLPYRIWLQREAIHPPAPFRAEREELYRNCSDNIIDPEAYLQKWFLGADIEEIRRENVKEFFLWAFFNRGGPPGDDDKELEGYIATLEEQLGREIRPGRGNAKCLRLTLDECVGFVDFLTFCSLRFHGFHFHRTSIKQSLSILPIRPHSFWTTYRSPASHITYWHRPHTSKTKLPIIFIHGIGIGLYPYTSFLNELNAKTDDKVGIIALEIMNISFRLTHSGLPREETCREISQILNQHFPPDQKFILISHSYGTVITTHLLHDPNLSPRIGPVVLMDPVSICLHLPSVAYNFTRRIPKAANEYQLYYFASMDPGVAHTLGRRFFWNENVLWKQDLGDRKVTACLAGRDLIVDTEAVGRYLCCGSLSGRGTPREGVANGSAGRLDMGRLIDVEGEEEDTMITGEVGESTKDDEVEEEWKYREWKGEGVEVLWFAGLDHAQVFDKKSSRRRVIEVVRRYCEGVE
ncbi:carboxypeptidase cpdS protein [Rutstroemia sp. NJR-2017a BBW]|nr:carboxypeptidase cpdS protein [Rutstroemia sp. NJR-2017a BBW]